MCSLWYRGCTSPDIPVGSPAISIWSSTDFAGDVARTGASASLASRFEMRDCGVNGASALLGTGRCSLGTCSTTGCGSGSCLLTVRPLGSSGGERGLDDAMLCERDRRCGMAGTMRESGRRACLCADGAVSAAGGAMLALALVFVMFFFRHKRCSIAAAAPGISSLDFEPIILERSGQVRWMWDRGGVCRTEKARWCNGVFRSTGIVGIAARSYDASRELDLVSLVGPSASTCHFESSIRYKVNSSLC